MKYNVLVFLVAHPRKVGGEVRVTKEDVIKNFVFMFDNGNIFDSIFGNFQYSRSTKEAKE